MLIANTSVHSYALITLQLASDNTIIPVPTFVFLPIASTY